MERLLQIVLLLALALIQGLNTLGAANEINSFQGSSLLFEASWPIAEIPLVPVVGGYPEPEGKPFMASLRSRSGKHFCGGSLIHPKVVLTAAHCLDREPRPDVHIGRVEREGKDVWSGFDKHTTRAGIAHESYKESSMDYDIAVLILDSASDREVLPLADSADCFEDKDGCTVHLLGWGKTSFPGKLADVLQEATTTSVRRSECLRLLGQGKITKRMICAGEIEVGGIDACAGDSGGPMIQNDKQVGTISWGIGCANAQSPGVYTSVPELRLWINFRLYLLDLELPLDTDPCQCTKDGVSNRVSTGRIGCKQHLVDDGDTDFFCMTIGGMACPDANPSEAFTGAAWKYCD